MRNAKKMLRGMAETKVSKMGVIFFLFKYTHHSPCISSISFLLSDEPSVRIDLAKTNRRDGGDR